ncbi:MAG: PriCT-2 domain-containing protein [Pseudomonadota bacterium]
MSHDIDISMAEQMLYHVPSHDRETWVQVGKALAAEFGDAAGDAFDRWSASADNYEPRAVAATWRSCLRKPGGYSIGTVVKLAMDAGFKFPSQSLSEAERREQQRRRAEGQAMRRDAVARRLADDLQKAQDAERVALAQWRAGRADGRSPYLERKGVDAEVVRFTEAGWILVPMLRYDLPREQSLKGLQIIRPDGTKKYTFGMDKCGASCRLGLVVDRDPIIVCEGYSTGLSIRMAVERRLPVFVAFDAGNLPHVAAMLRQVHPTCLVLFAADDDWQTRDKRGRPTNPGRVAAQEAAELVQEEGGRACWTHPVFPRACPRRPEDTDFNDLHRLAGLKSVAEQIQLAIDVTKELARG